jgi:hypothetical protein
MQAGEGKQHSSSEQEGSPGKRYRKLAIFAPKWRNVTGEFTQS